VSGVKQVGLFLEVKPDTTTSSLVPTPLPSQVNSVEKSNELLAKEVEFACYKTDAIEIKNIKISAKDGEITLSGKVRSRAEKLLAERISKEVPGVKSVNNELEVKLN
jgi:osmotically-inducible protein OsmY